MKEYMRKFFKGFIKPFKGIGVEGIGTFTVIVMMMAIVVVTIFIGVHAWIGG